MNALNDAMTRFRARVVAGKIMTTSPDLRPGCSFGAVEEQRLNDLSDDISEIKSRINQLFLAILAAVAVNIILDLIR